MTEAPIRTERRGAVLEVTLDRPRANAIDLATSRIMGEVFTAFRDDPDLRVAILTAAGERFFCPGWDLKAAAAGDAVDGDYGKGGFGGLQELRGLNKPVIAAVNGIACGGAFYLLGEADFVIAAAHATFFDPHVTYGMPTVYEPIHMLGKMPFHEIMRISLLGNHERMSAGRAHEIGLVSEVVPADELAERAGWAAGAIASAPPLAIQGTVRAIWHGLEHSRSQALDAMYAFIGLGTDAESIRQGQETFASGRRIEWRLR